MSVQQVKFKEIADAIRGKTNTADKIKPSEFAGKVDEVYEAGKKSVVIEGTKSGEVVTITDVSPYEHEMTVKVRSKNIFGFSKEDFENAETAGSGKKISIQLKPLCEYTLSTDAEGDTYSTNMWFNGTSSKDDGVYKGNSRTITTDSSGVAYVLIRVTELEKIFANNYIQLEEGKSATEYTPYIADLTTVNIIVSTDGEYAVATYPANADGTVDGVTSRYPTTILSTDKPGIIIDCTYNRDINKLEEVGIELGKKSEYNRFWDSAQVGGNRTIFLYLFAGGAWTPSTLKPKHKMVPPNASSMFYLCGYGNGAGLIDFRTIADKFDFSKATNADNIFYSAAIDFITADLSNAKSINSAFNGGYSSRITTLTLKLTSATTSASSAFTYLSTLTNLTFMDGSEIACSLNFSSCTNLTHDSLMSIINHLKDGVSGLTLTLGATNLAKLTDSEKAIATQKGWTLL